MNPRGMPFWMVAACAVAGPVHAGGGRVHEGSLLTVAMEVRQELSVPISYEALPTVMGVHYREPLASDPPGLRIYGMVYPTAAPLSVEASQGDGSSLDAARETMAAAIDAHGRSDRPGVYALQEHDGHLHVVGVQRIADASGRLEPHVSPMEAIVRCSYRQVAFHDMLVDFTKVVSRASGQDITLTAPSAENYGHGAGAYDFDCREEPARHALSRLLDTYEYPMTWDLLWPPKPDSGYVIAVNLLPKNEVPDRPAAE